MNIIQLKYFTEVGKKQSITRAAKSLHISQQGLSNSIKRLENELGIKLFSYTDNGFVLTNIGKRIMVIAESLIEKYDAYIQMILDVVKDEKPAMTVSYENLILSQAIPFEMQFKIGDVRINSIQRLNIQQCIDDIKSQKADLAIVFLPKNSEGLTYIPILNCRPVIIVNKNHSLANKSEIHISDLANQPLLWAPISATFLDEFQQVCIDSGFYPRIKAEYLQVSAVAQAVSNGDGYMLGGNILSFDTEDSLVRIPLAHDSLRFCIGFLIHPNFLGKKEIVSYIRAIKTLF